MRYLLMILILCFSLPAFGEKVNPVFRGIIKGNPSPVTGVVMDEATARQVAKDRVKIKDLEQVMELKIKLWDFKEKAYLDGLDKADKKIKELSKKSWWDKNRTWVVATLGFVAGVATTAGVYKLAVNTK